MIVVCEPLVREQEHVPFNSAFLAAIRLAFPDQQVRFMAEARHLRLVKELIDSMDLAPIDYIEIALPPRHATLRHRMWRDCRLVRRLMSSFDRETTGHLVFSSTTKGVLAALAFFVRRRPVNINVQLVLHGGLANITEKRRNPLARLLNIRQFLRCACHRRIQFLVLEEWILRSLVTVAARIAANAAAIPHPIPLLETSTVSPTLGLPLRVGFLGLATPQKGFDHFLALASDPRWHEDDSVTFDLIGRLPPDADQRRAAEVFGPEGLNQRIDREEYTQRLAACHLIYVHLDPDHYGLSASGVLLDAIAWEKPILCGGPLLSDPSLNSVGPIGYYCAPEESAVTVADIVEKMDMTAYSQMVARIQQLQSERKYTALAARLKQSYESYFFSSTSGSSR